MPIERLKRFRQEIYSSLKRRKDAAMNLLDAISSFGHQSRSIVQLSEARCFERKYSSVTDAISDGLPTADWRATSKHTYQLLFENKLQQIPCFLTDCTGNPRAFSKKLADKTVTHHPNPAPGNKPICVGHQYSCTALLPSDWSVQNKKWIIPLSMHRVNSNQKGNEVGVQQILDHISDFKLTDETVMSVADSLYGSVNCRVKSAEAENLVYVFRVRNNRNLFFKPGESDSSDKGRKKEYGDKMSLSDSNTHKNPNRSAETGFMNRKEKICRVKIEAWDDMLMRGTATYRGYEHPMTLIRITVFNDNDEAIFKRPLWLAVLGKRRSEISLVTIYQKYASRYDIEHFFRFAKSKLLLDVFQTPDVTNEENWWHLCALAYNQLYLAKALVGSTPKPWERYLPEYKKSNKRRSNLATPTQTQRGFDLVLQSIGTPAAACVQRGVSPGKLKGQASLRREDKPIIFKAKKSPKIDQNINVSGFEIKGNISNPKIIGDFIHGIHYMVENVINPSDQLEPMLFNTS